VTLADLLTDLGNAIGMDAFVGPHRGRGSRDDRAEVRATPHEVEAALALLGSFPGWIGDLAQLSGPPGRVDYRGGGHQATVRVLDVTALGFAHAGEFVVSAIEHDVDAVLDRDVEGKIVAVTLDEGGGESRFIIARGLTTAPWAFVISADARETAAAVANAASDVIRSAG
jgi:hypothetical protein